MSTSHLYLHIPFCPRKCSYCAFETHVGSLRLVEPYVEAVCREARALARESEGGPLHTVYLGGGTPSLLTPRQIGTLLHVVDECFSIAAGAEVTMEAHPATVTSTTLRAYVRAGVNRISFGGESLVPRELKAIGREHSADRVTEVTTEARAAGFGSINVDLMYGLPGQGRASWRETLQKATALDVDHLSLYPLSVEPKTIFARQYRQSQLGLPSDGEVVRMYEIACGQLSSRGFEHYEVANWSRPGHQCRHNLAYWRNQEFYALGVGAHGYIRPHRTENVRGTRRYIERVSHGSSATETRTLVDRDVEFTETVMLGLRLLRDGLDIEDVRRSFGIDVTTVFRRDVDELSALGLVRLEAGRMLLSESAVPVANEIWSRFIL